MNDIVKQEPSEMVVHDATNMAQQMIKLASDPNMDVDKLQALISMQEHMEDRDAIKAFNMALVEFKKNPPRIIKNMAVSFGNTKYKHATIDSVCRQLDPALYEIGLAFRWRVKSSNKLVQVACVLSHVDGYSEESQMEEIPDLSGSIKGVQAVGSTITYLKRYTLLAALGLAEQGEDDDGMKARLTQSILDEQVEDIQKLIDETGADVKALCKNFKVGSIAELSNSQYGAVISMLNIKKKALQNENP